MSYAVTTSVDGSTAAVYVGGDREAASLAFVGAVQDAQFERLWETGKPTVTVRMMDTEPVVVVLAKVRVDDNWADC